MSDKDYEGRVYSIVRFYGARGKDSRVMKTGLLLSEAQAHCACPTTSGDGWFDGFTKGGAS